MLTMMPPDDGRAPSRTRLSPLSELAETLAIRLRRSEYSPTREELDAVTKCKNEVLVNSLKYPLLFGVVAGSVSYRLQVLARTFSIAVASALGLEFGRQKAEYACIKHFISLEDSQIKSVLVDILQRDFPDHPLLREASQSHSSHFEGDEASEHRLLSDGKGRGFSAENKGLNTLVDSPPEYGTEDRGHLEERRGRTKNMVNRRGIRSGRSQVADTYDSDHSQALGEATDIIVDPFSLGFWTNMDDTPSASKENQVTTRQEARRSRMTSQKREHNRMLREETGGA